MPNRNPQRFAVLCHADPHTGLQAELFNTVDGSVTQKRAPPKHNAHTSQTNRKIHHLVLLVASCLEGKSCHSNKPQKRKHRCQVETFLSHYLKKYCNVGTDDTNAVNAWMTYSLCFVHKLLPLSSCRFIIAKQQKV